MLQASHVDVDGARIHMVSGGHGPAILFLHGFPEFWFAWRAQLSEFVRTHRVFAIDLPGCNLSAPLPDVADYALGPVAARIAALMRQISPDQRMSVVAHDLGGIIAWELAARHPALVERLVVINAPPAAVLARQLASDPDQREASAYMRAFRDPSIDEILSARGFAQLGRFLFEGARDPAAFTSADRKAYVASWSRPGGLRSALNYYRAADFESAPTPPPVEAPTLVIWGERDPYLLPGCLEGIEAMGRDVTVRRVPDATHWVVREEGALVNACLRDFLESSQAAPPSVREFWYERAGARLFAAERGRGLPVIYLHGGLSDHRTSLLFMGALAASHRLITPDVRGAGRSIYAGALTWEQLADDVAALMTHLNLDRAVIGGVSLGAAIALTFAQRYPRRTRALLLLQPAHAGQESGARAAFQATAARVNELGQRALREGIAAIYPLYEDQPPTLRDRMIEIASEFDPASFAATARFMISGGEPFERFEALEALTMPTLVVPGSDPVHPPELAELYTAALPNCKRGAPGDALDAAVRAFLRDLDAAPPRER